jgi:hypothetical protein
MEASARSNQNTTGPPFAFLMPEDAISWHGAELTWQNCSGFLQCIQENSRCVSLNRTLLLLSTFLSIYDSSLFYSYHYRRFLCFLTVQCNISKVIPLQA